MDTLKVGGIPVNGDGDKNREQNNLSVFLCALVSCVKIALQVEPPAEVKNLKGEACQFFQC